MNGHGYELSPSLIKENQMLIDEMNEIVEKLGKEKVRIQMTIQSNMQPPLDEKSFRIAKNAGVIFVMNECPKKILEN